MSFAGVRDKLFLVAKSANTKGAAVFSTVVCTLCSQADNKHESKGVVHDRCTSRSASACIRCMFSCQKRRCAIYHGPRCLQMKGEEGTSKDLQCIGRATGIDLLLPSKERCRKGGQRASRGVRRVVNLSTKRFARVTVVTRKSFLGLLRTRSGRHGGVFSRVFRARVC